MRWTAATAIFVMTIGVCVKGQYAPQKPKGCGIPIVVSTVQNPEPAKLHGIRYKYRQSGEVPTTNQIINVTMLGRTGLPFSILPATGIVMQFGQYNDDTNNCVNLYFIGLCGANGQCPGKGLTSADGFSPVTQDFSLLYLDVGNFLLWYACSRPNYKSGMCDQASFHVITWSRPDQMTADQMKAIDDTLDDVLAPYCYSSADLGKQVYTASKPFCVQIDYPPCIKSMVDALNNQIKNSITN